MCATPPVKLWHYTGSARVRVAAGAARKGPLKKRPNGSAGNFRTAPVGEHATQLPFGDGIKMCAV